MKQFLNLVLGVLLITLFHSAFAQSNYNLPPLKHYDKATIGLKSFQRLQVRNLQILNDSVRYSFNVVIQKKNLQEINYIRVVEGNKAKGGALIGGATMLLLSLVSIIEVQADIELEL